VCGVDFPCFVVWGIFPFLLIDALDRPPPTIENPVASVSTVQKLGSMEPRKKIETDSLSLRLSEHLHTQTFYL
jgi:hypothetical protein